MKLLFNDKSSISIKTRDCLAWSEVHKIYRHLQHVNIPFKEWDNPHYASQHSFKSLVDKLAHFGKLLDIDIDMLKTLYIYVYPYMYMYIYVYTYIYIHI